MRGRPGLALDDMPRQPPLRLLRSGEPSRLQSTPTGRRRTQNSGGNKRSRNDSCAAPAETSNRRRRFNPASGWRRIRVVLAEDSPGRTSPARPLGEAVRSLGALARRHQIAKLRLCEPGVQQELRGIVQSPTRFQVSPTVCITTDVKLRGPERSDGPRQLQRLVRRRPCPYVPPDIYYFMCTEGQAWWCG
jgi:hypothetical protein